MSASRGESGHSSANVPEIGRSILAVAHPGHELAVHGWLCRERPTVVLFTDGSGSDGTSRLTSTRRVLAEAGAREGPEELFGRFTERVVYAALLAGDAAFFIGVAEDLVELFADPNVAIVVGEAAEGYSPTHDIWRTMVDHAVIVADRRRVSLGAPRLVSRQFLLFDRQTNGPQDRAVEIELTPEGLAAKLAAAHAYPEVTLEVAAALHADAGPVLRLFPDLEARVVRRLEQLGSDAYRVECLFPTFPGAPGAAFYDEDPPFYHAYAEKLRGLGRVTEVITRVHLDAVARSLAQWEQESLTG